MTLKSSSLFCIMATLLFTSAARAEEGTALFGTPMVQSTGQILLDGHEVTLWGIATLAGDQQCWQNDRAWDCGGQAATALKHFIEAQLVHCHVKSDLGGGRVVGWCFCKKNGQSRDIARYLVGQGWATEQKDVSGGLYTLEENTARQKRRGIWTSRFQTAADWRDGTQRFVAYDIAPEPTPNVTVVNQTNINATTIVPQGPTKIIIRTPHRIDRAHTESEPRPRQPEAETTPAPADGNVPKQQKQRQQQNPAESNAPLSVYDQRQDRLSKQRSAQPITPANIHDRLQNKPMEHDGDPDEPKEQP